MAGFANPGDDELRGLLERVRRIAVVGLSPKPWRDSHRVARYLVERGYEVVPVYPREQEILVKSVEVLTPLAGRRPIGYRAPAWQLSADTLALLAGEGFDYSSNMMDRLVPYVHPPVGGRSLVEIPVSWILDDAPFFLFSGQRAMQPPGPVLQGWLTEFEGISAAHGVTTFTFHPQLIGRPSRLACLRELIEHVRHTPRVWIAPLAEISAHVRGAA